MIIIAYSLTIGFARADCAKQKNRSIDAKRVLLGAGEFNHQDW